MFPFSLVYPESFLYLGEVVGEHGYYFFFIDEVEGEAFACLHQSEAKLIFTLLVLISENTHIYFNKWHKGEISKLLFYIRNPEVDLFDRIFLFHPKGH